LRTAGSILCTCKASGYKTLETLYGLIFNDKPSVTHRAGDDVKTLVEIILKKKLNIVYKTSLGNNSNLNQHDQSQNIKQSVSQANVLDV
jgi:hypothetical protein